MDLRDERVERRPIAGSQRAVIVALGSDSPKKRREAQDRLVAIAAQPLANQPAKRR